MTVPLLTRPNAYAYSRWSRVHQGGGSSAHRQSANLEDFCTYNKLNLIDSIADRGLSAYHGKNLQEESALDSFLHAAEQGIIPTDSWLLVDSL